MHDYACSSYRNRAFFGDRFIHNGDAKNDGEARKTSTRLVRQRNQFCRRRKRYSRSDRAVEQGAHQRPVLSQDGVQWQFNPPASPHFGGVWERLVRSSKTALKAIAGKQRVNDEILLTFVAEAESLLNSRSLTSVSSDPQDLEALTPNHFLLGRLNPALPLDVVTNKDLSSRRDGDMRKSWYSISGNASTCQS